MKVSKNDDALFSDFPFVTHDKHKKICELVANGYTITEISKMEGFPPPYTIHLWRKKFPNFEKALDFAREIRGEHLFEKSLEMLKKDISKGDVPQAKLKFQILKWASGLENKRFKNDQPKASETKQVIVINTGIHRN